ncbi:MAG: CsbD family protein [Gammaproteobacteria bacterium]
MNWYQVQRNWSQIQGKARQLWGDLTEQELETIKGERYELIGLLQAKYGLSREQAQELADDWVRRL